MCQIEKNGQIVVDKELLAGQNRTGGIIALIKGLGDVRRCFLDIKKKEL